ncbi:MAG: DUF2332 family protein [Pseudomonadota bacterium]
MTNAVRAAFQDQSRACAKLGSPFMERLMALCATRLSPKTAVGTRILNWPGDPAANADSVPLRLAGALHALKREGHSGLTDAYPPQQVSDEALWDAVAAAFSDAPDFLHQRLDSPPQTNEVRRSAALIPALHLLAAKFGMPIRLVEIGCSAGLNLHADRFRLSAGDSTFGPAGSDVVLRPGWTGAPPSPAPPHIAERIGLDLNPLDPATDADRLLSYIWPDQPDRIVRTEAAIAIGRKDPASLILCDAVDWLRTELNPVPGLLTVLFHTIAWQYLPTAAQSDGNDLIARAGKAATVTAPLARFAMEAAGPYAALSLEIWPGQGIIPLGQADYHGRWVDWGRAPFEGDGPNDT